MLALSDVPVHGDDERTGLAGPPLLRAEEAGERRADSARLTVPAAGDPGAEPDDPVGPADRRPWLFRGGRTSLVTPTGPLNGAAGTALLAQIRALTAACRSLIVDLRRVDYVDSQGAKALLALRDAVSEAGGRLRLVIAEGSPVERTLRLLHFDSLFPIFRRVTDAWRGKPAGQKTHHGAGEPRKRGARARRKRGDV
jgi:anti-anti-sigma factor